MPLPILYTFRRCPYAMRARLAILASGGVVTLREVALRDKPAAMIAASPKATVPVLVLPDGRVIDESLDIMLWTVSTTGSAGRLGQDEAGLVAANDGPFKHHLDRYKYADRYGVDPIEHRTAATAHLQRLDDWLGGRARGRGDLATLGDLAILPFVRQFAETDRRYFDALPFGNLQRWLERFLASPMFAHAMIRLPPWQPGDQAVPFPLPQTPAA